MSLFEKHNAVLTKAIDALHSRKFYAAFPEHPAPAVYGETADADGQAKFKAAVGNKFSELKQTNAEGWAGQEESPYLQEPLNISYPTFSVDTLINNAKAAFHTWRKASVEDRAAILMESLNRMKGRFFEIAYATMHTTGQGYMMAFQASGPHAADRALEAIAAGYEELKRFPSSAVWDKPMGKFNIQLNKEWRAVPKGISVVIGCSTFPTWNSVTGIYGSLITGNAVIVKPHPGAILPIAIVVAEIQKVLSENNFDPNTCQLAVDTYDKMITKELAEHKDVKLIDYTGNSNFGSYLEALPGKIVFTEKTGVNSVILDSVVDIDKAAANLAFSVNLYSGQMCTAPQNFYIPEGGISTPNGIVSFDEFAQKLVDNINGLIDNPKAGPFVLGAVQNKKTSERVLEAEKLTGKVWLKSRTFENPMFKNARVATPVIVEVGASKKEIFSKELFGPIVLLIKTKNTDQSIELAQEMAIHHGAISCGAYTTNPAVREKIADEMALAATPVSFNLTGGIYMNQNAAFSDFHVTGGNPAGNASFTNPEYVTKRFTWVGHREPVM
ncbi:MAG TPA: phenylacetic acid degradation protein PaaN [Cyclobacteriaceae bacterium]|nr:phenylacetic acid degradation protein PaaN [Cyclobacteriaceae bacterium]HMV10312.1 phenylacetic acid degradation protein PaaN [Cyclobacteriaceae bacterium]HMV89840.1 phenylacetic acid degradation protein PaaN [Cyclobacteriaceae bacterium]HMX02781.1 phenylacetic acid degradation protein PaaN [Cyclobacteriaceae bacterium]HMX50065.1 phenylacetic acid degradation protein PaaN [Cyclobacteriaceae bacterium]